MFFSVCYAFVGSCLFVRVVTSCWERTDLLALVCGVLLRFCHFPIGILSQEWYLIVSIPDLCILTHSYNFSAQFIKITSRYKKIGYNSNVLQKTTCLVSIQSGLATLLSSLIARQWVRLQTL